MTTIESQGLSVSLLSAARNAAKSYELDQRPEYIAQCLRTMTDYLLHEADPSVAAIVTSSEY